MNNDSLKSLQWKIDALKQENAELIARLGVLNMRGKSITNEVIKSLVQKGILPASERR
jgi:hypothetical protein